MTGGEAMVKSLVRNGVDTLFAIPGIQMDAFFNAAYDDRNLLRVIHTRHEQACAYMAFGYAEVSGRVGACAVVPGPGLLNATAALSTAYACNTPLLCLSGQIPSDGIGRGFGLLHEIPDQLSLIKGLTKWAERVEHPSKAPELMREAFRQLQTGRLRPVELEAPMDVLASSADVTLLDPVAPMEEPEPDPDAIAAAAKLLGEAKRPMIMVGGGIKDAEEPLLALAEMLEAPVVMTRSALGAVSDHHYLAQKTVGGHRLWPKADVVLAIGTRLHPTVPSWGLDDGIKIIRIDVDPVELRRAGAPDVGVVARAHPALSALVDAVPKHNAKRESMRNELTILTAALNQEYHDEVGPQMAYLDAIRAALPDDGIVVEELTQVAYVARFGLPMYRPRSYVSSGYQGTLGFGFGTALGAKVAAPDRPVLSLCGDGGFMYQVQELSTAVQQQLQVVTLVFNDGAYGNVQRMQIEDYGGKVVGTDLHNPDFVALAESFGAQGLRATTPAEVKSAIERGFNTAGPTLIDVPLGKTPAPWKFLVLPRAR
ncbi:MAG: thiamine pyrophosphate-dependent enzyme [Pseudomonadota bacterium]